MASSVMSCCCTISSSWTINHTTKSTVPLASRIKVPIFQIPISSKTLLSNSIVPPNMAETSHVVGGFREGEHEIELYDIESSMEELFSPNNAGNMQPCHSEPKEGSGTAERRFEIFNSYGQKLVGILNHSNSEDLIVLCHGFRSSKKGRTISKVADALVAEGISTFRFDFSGNGESEGSFQYGNYWTEVEDLRAVILFLSERKLKVKAIVGHSKGGDVVILYASKYHDIPMVINISGRFDLKMGIEERLGEDFMERIKTDGFIDVKNNNTGAVEYRVTEASLMERLQTDIHAACLDIDKSCKFFTVHGSSDEVIPVGDAEEFHKLIPNHKLHIINSADHCYTSHYAELASIVLDFLKSKHV